MFHAAGLTSLGDALVGPRDVELYEVAERRGLLSARVNMLLSYDAFEGFRRLGLRSGFGGSRLRFGGGKAFVGRAIGGRGVPPLPPPAARRGRRPVEPRDPP